MALDIGNISVFARVVFITSLLPVGNDFHRGRRGKKVCNIVLYLHGNTYEGDDNKLYILKYTHFYPATSFIHRRFPFLFSRDFCSARSWKTWSVYFFSCVVRFL